MELKDVSTADSLQELQVSSFDCLDFLKEERGQEAILAELLKGYNENEESSLDKIIETKGFLESKLDSFSEVEQQLLKKGVDGERLKDCLSLFCQKQVVQKNVLHFDELNEMKKEYIGYLESKIGGLMSKVRQYRQKTKELLLKKEKLSKENRLVYKVYNIKKYLEQLRLVREVTDRICNISKDKNPDIRAVQQLFVKEYVPYDFYSKFCLSHCCRIIQRRIDTGQLIMLTHSSRNLQLLQEIKFHFFGEKGLDEKCSTILTLAKHIRIKNNHNICEKNGFFFYFKPFFIESLLENKEISQIEFMKARSIMQSQEEMIELWGQFEELKAQEYCFWHYKQLKWLESNQTLHLLEVQNVLQHYSSHYSWVRQLKLKISPLTQNFYSFCFKKLMLRVIRPLLLYLYFIGIGADHEKQLSKCRRQYTDYWLYWLFRSYKIFYNFMKETMREQVERFDKKNVNCIFEESELNVEQYCTYYRQLPKLMRIYLGQNKLTEEAEEFWRQLTAKFAQSLGQTKAKLIIDKYLEQEYKNLFFYRKEQAKLQKILSSLKGKLSIALSEEVYCYVMSLHFNISNYFLLEKGLKVLGKEVQKEVRAIREVAYSLFYK